MLNDGKLLQRGMQTPNDIDGEQGAKVMQALVDIAPDLGWYIIGFGFGEIYNRPHLDNQRHELVTLAALAAQGGCEKQLAVHIHTTLNVGLSHEEIVETFIHCAPYLGFPKALNAVLAAKEVLAEGQRRGGEGRPSESNPSFRTASNTVMIPHQYPSPRPP